MADLHKLNMAQIRVLQALVGCGGWMTPRAIADAVIERTSWHSMPGPSSKAARALVDRGLATVRLGYGDDVDQFRATAAGRRWIRTVRM